MSALYVLSMWIQESQHISFRVREAPLDGLWLCRKKLSTESGVRAVNVEPGRTLICPGSFHMQFFFFFPSSLPLYIYPSSLSRMKSCFGQAEIPKQFI